MFRNKNLEKISDFLQEIVQNVRCVEVNFVGRSISTVIQKLCVCACVCEITVL